MTLAEANAFDGFFYCLKGEGDEARLLSLPFTPESGSSAAWLMEAIEPLDLDAETYWRCVYQVVLKPVPQGYFAWQGKSFWFGYLEAVDDNGAIVHDGLPGLHLVEFSPQRIRYAWVEEREMETALGDGAMQAFIRECTDWEQHDAGAERQMELTDEQCRILDENVDWTNRLHEELNAAMPLTAVGEPERGEPPSPPEEVDETVSEPEAAEAVEPPAAESGQDAAPSEVEAPATPTAPEASPGEKTLHERPFSKLPASEQIAAVVAMLNDDRYQYFMPLGRALKVGFAHSETRFPMYCAVIQAFQRLLLKGRTAQQIMEYLSKTLELDDPMVVNVHKTGRALTEIAAEFAIGSMTRERAIAEIAPLVGGREEHAATLLDGTIDVMTHWHEGKLTAAAKLRSAKRARKARGGRFGCAGILLIAAGVGMTLAGAACWRAFG